QKVADQDVVIAAAIQRPHDGAADETRAARDENLPGALTPCVKIVHDLLTMSMGIFTLWRTALIVVPKIRSFRPVWPCEAMTSRSGCNSAATRTISCAGLLLWRTSVSTSIWRSRSEATMRARYSPPSVISAVEESEPNSWLVTPSSTCRKVTRA